MGKSAIPAAVPAPAAAIASLPVPDGRCDLLELLAGVPDGRTGQGRDHPVAAVLALAAAAVVAGMKGDTAISGWVADVPPEPWPACTCGAAPRRPAAVEDHDLAGDDRRRDRELDAAAGTWLMSLAGLDGRTRPARRGGLPVGIDAGQAGRQGRQGRQEP